MSSAPNGWKSLTAGEVQEQTQKVIFGDPFDASQVEHGDVTAADIKNTDAYTTTGETGASGVFSAETITINAGETLEVKDGLILFASNKIEIKTDGELAGSGRGGRGAKTVKEADLGFTDAVSPDIPSSRYLYAPEWIGRTTTTDDNTDDTTEDDTDDDGGFGAIIDRLTDVLGTVTTTPATTTGDYELETNVTIGDGVPSEISDRMKKYFSENGADVALNPPSETGVNRGRIPISETVPNSKASSIASTHQGLPLPQGEAGMLGEHDFFEQINSEAGWLEEMYLYAVIDVHMGFANKPALKGGRGGTGGILRTGLKTVTDDNATDVDGTSNTVSDNDAAGGLPTDAFFGGDGGAAVLLMAPKVTVENGATVNLQGTVPDSIKPQYKQRISDGVILPERGRAGKFGCVAREYDIHSGAIHSHGDIRPAVPGGINMGT